MFKNDIQEILKEEIIIYNVIFDIFQLIIIYLESSGFFNLTLDERDNWNMNKLYE